MQSELYGEHNDGENGGDGKYEGVCPLSGNVYKCIKQGT